MITCISNSSQMLSGWVLGPHLLGILLAFRISWYRVNPYNSAQMTNMSIMMLCLFSQTFLANQNKTSYLNFFLFFCITCFSHLALITCSTRLNDFWIVFALFPPQRVKVNSKPRIQEFTISKVLVTINLLPNILKKGRPSGAKSLSSVALSSSSLRNSPPL